MAGIENQRVEKKKTLKFYSHYIEDVIRTVEKKKKDKASTLISRRVVFIVVVVVVVVMWKQIIGHVFQSHLAFFSIKFCCTFVNYVYAPNYNISWLTFSQKKGHNFIIEHRKIVKL